ncbi:MAG: hypothetical protein BJ554DRAFT_965 [Olpidium bornovanus]|uniref:Uncharacterized protein n=1 Tax=Olpidium bornovanus TaxID=278681 RepID=A0A8H7ZSE7_9FUNG|nr:MAG: hypothetical protein BJ554DRAFT_965 [Olpidium bornovanus]
MWIGKVLRCIGVATCLISLFFSLSLFLSAHPDVAWDTSEICDKLAHPPEKREKGLPVHPYGRWRVGLGTLDVREHSLRTAGPIQEDGRRSAEDFPENVEDPTNGRR